MIEYIGSFTKLTCDKCGNTQEEYASFANDNFFNEGWSVNPRAKKYIHKCGKCNGKNAPNKIWDRLPLHEVE